MAGLNYNSAAHVHFYIAAGFNAALACVLAAVRLGCKVTVVVQMSMHAGHVSELRKAGATGVIRCGDTWEEADGFAAETVKMLNRDRHGNTEEAIYLHPHDDPNIWEGNAKIVPEIQGQMQRFRKDTHQPPKRLFDAVVCAVRGGGLLCGLRMGLDRLGRLEWVVGKKWSKTPVIAAEIAGVDSLRRSVEAKKVVKPLAESRDPGLTTDATWHGARPVSETALSYAQQENVLLVAVTDEEAADARRRFASQECLIVDQVCGAVLAVCYKGKLWQLLPGLESRSNVVLVICGGRSDVDVQP